MTGVASGGVDWAIDGNTVATDAALTNGWTIDTGNGGDGTLLLTATIKQAGQANISISRRLSVVPVGFSAAPVPENSERRDGFIKLGGSAASNFGIAKVAAALDGQPLQTLTSPNGTAPAAYAWTIDGATAAPGPHVLTVTTTNSRGDSRSDEIAFTVQVGPPMTLTAPADNAIIGTGALRIMGTITTTTVGLGIANVTAYIGDTKIADIAQSDGGFSFDTAPLNVAPGTYILRVRGTFVGTTELRRTITVSVT